NQSRTVTPRKVMGADCAPPVSERSPLRPIEEPVVDRSDIATPATEDRCDHRMMEQNDDAYLHQALRGGLEPGPISGVEDDERWALRFHHTAGRVRQALDGRALDVEHIGSTSAPGLAAKPSVYMLVTVDDVTGETAYLPALESIGFVL